MDLEIGKLIELVEGSPREMKEFVQEHDLDDTDIRKILEAERNAKNRGTVVQFLQATLEQMRERNGPQEAVLGTLKAVRTEDGSKIVLDVGGVQMDLDEHPELDFARKLKDDVREKHNQIAERTAENYTGPLAAGITGFPAVAEGGYNPAQAPGFQTGMRRAPAPSSTDTAQQGPAPTPQQRQPGSDGMSEMEELAHEIEKAENEPSNLGEAMEESGSTKSDELGREMDDLDSQMEEIEDKKDELRDRFEVDEDRLEGKSLSELEALEETLEEREELRDEMLEKYPVEKDMLKDKTVDELKSLQNRLQKEAELREDLSSNGYSMSDLREMDMQELKQLKNELRRKREEAEERFDVDPEKLRGKTKEAIDEFVDRMQAREELASELEKYGYDVEEKSLDELKDLMQETERKKAMLKQMETSFPDEKLSKISIEQLQEIKEEKEEREQLIQELKEQGMDEKMLRDSSTADLRRLSEEVNGSEDETEPEPEAEDKDEEKDEEEIKEEAEEDLKMLMGATEQSEKFKEDAVETLTGLGAIKKRINDRWKSVSEGDKGEKKKKKERFRKVMDLLEEYEMKEDEEAVIKTAHVMKGYLEFRLGIDREMTYKELSDALKDVDAKTDLEPVIDFFEAMSKDQYTGNIRADKNEVIPACKSVVQELG